MNKKTQRIKDKMKALEHSSRVTINEKPSPRLYSIDDHVDVDEFEIDC